VKIIAFGGLARAGKTTAAAAASKALFEAGFIPVLEEFAKPLKEASRLCGFLKEGSTAHLYREFCQFAGSLARRESVDWWVDLCAARINEVSIAEQEALASDGTWNERCIVLDDIRYPNELDLIRRLGGHTVFVSAYNRLDTSRDLYTHESESMAQLYEQGKYPDDLFDFAISNNAAGDANKKSFQTTVASVAVSLATTAKEEIR